MASICLPNLQCSFPIGCHPLYSSIRPSLEDWTASLTAGERNTKLNAESRKRLAAEKRVLASCIMMPLATDARIENASKFICWCFHFDDAVDDLQGLGADFQGAKRLVESYLAIIQGSKPPNDFSQSYEFSQFCDLWNALRADMPPKQYQRFTNRVSELLEASMEQVNLRKSTMVMSLEELLAHRRVLICMMALETLIEYAIGVELQDDAVSNKDLQEAERLVADHVSCVNDLFSFLVDSANGDAQFNIVHKIMHSSEQSLSLEEAVTEAHKMLQSFEDRFKKLCEDIRRSSCCDHAVEAYLEGLSYCMSGIIEWHWQTGRYRAPNWYPPENRQGTLYL